MHTTVLARPVSMAIAAISSTLADPTPCAETVVASLASTHACPDRITLGIQPCGKPVTHLAQLPVDRVIITTGPAHGTIVAQSSVLRRLAQQGLLQPDPLGLGVLVGRLGQAIDTDGTVVTTLLVAGPLAHEQYGELMGMPQVSAQANELAMHVSSLLSTMSENELAIQE